MVAGTSCSEQNMERKITKNEGQEKANKKMAYDSRGNCVGFIWNVKLVHFDTQAFYH
jgi:hypothetical protein